MSVKKFYANMETIFYVLLFMFSYISNIYMSTYGQYWKKKQRYRTDILKNILKNEV